MEENTNARQRTPPTKKMAKTKVKVKVCVCLAHVCQMVVRYAYVSKLVYNETSSLAHVLIVSLLLLN